MYREPVLEGATAETNVAFPYKVVWEKKKKLFSIWILYLNICSLRKLINHERQWQQHHHQNWCHYKRNTPFISIHRIVIWPSGAGGSTPVPRRVQRRSISQTAVDSVARRPMERRAATTRCRTGAVRVLAGAARPPRTVAWAVARGTAGVTMCALTRRCVVATVRCLITLMSRVCPSRQWWWCWSRSHYSVMTIKQQFWLIFYYYYVNLIYMLFFSIQFNQCLSLFLFFF